MFLDPRQILSKLGLRKEMIAADFGSGSGGWAIPLAVLLDKGEVFAVDVQDSALSALEGRIRLQGISNIKKVLANAEDPISAISGNSCDLVLMTDLLFQIEERENVFKEAMRILKPGGRVLVVEWKPESPIGPRESKISQDEVRFLAGKIGFSLEKEFEAGDYHYGILFLKAV